MAKLKVMCARSMHGAVGAIGKAFVEASGNQIEFDFGTVGALETKLGSGETADVVILSVAGIGKLEAAGAAVAGSSRDIAKTFIAFCIRDGAARPDIATVEAFKRRIDEARAIAMSDPGVGGSAGVHLAKAFEQSGWAETIAAKALPQSSGVEVAKRVVEGKADFGLTLSGEVASVPGAVIAGPLPKPFGQDTIYRAAVMASCASKDAAAAFIAALIDPSTRETWTKAGFERP